MNMRWHWLDRGTFLRAGILLAACLLLGGCSPFFGGGSDDEKNSLIADARAKKAAYNYKEAVESLEKALEANPRLALAHWELGLIYYQNIKKPAFAIYHFEKLLELRPDWKQSDTARQFVNVCKIELAESAPLRPQTPQVQKEIDNLTAKQLELTKENSTLRQQHQVLQIYGQQLLVENNQLKAYLRSLQAQSNQPAVPPTQPRTPLNNSNRAVPPPVVFTATNAPITSAPSMSGAQANRDAQKPTPPTLAPGASKPSTTLPAQILSTKTHTVRSGETLASIARKRGVKLADLQAANPSVDARKLRAGQTLRVP